MIIEPYCFMRKYIMHRLYLMVYQTLWLHYSYGSGLGAVDRTDLQVYEVFSPAGCTLRLETLRRSA
jgi:hypothetical protein